MSLEAVNLWFKRALSGRGDCFNMQNSVHMEEFCEYLQQLRADTVRGQLMLGEALRTLETLKSAVRERQTNLSMADRCEFLDALADQVVTATGVAFTASMDLPSAVERVNSSNWSKFDADGQPIFDEDGKIAKNPETYRRVDLSGLF